MKIIMKFDKNAVRAESVIIAHSAEPCFNLSEKRLQSTEERPFRADSSRPGLIRLLAFAMSALVLPAIAGAGQLPPAAEEMAKAYGLDSWDQIEGLRYTWNAEIPGAMKPFDGGSGTIKISRAWEWEPKTGQVTYDGKDKDGKPVHVTYQHSQLGSQSDQVKNEIDPAFMNDQYWLLFPFHVAWDGSPTVTDEGTQKLPLGEGSAEKIVVKYPSEGGGYTPGDTWDLYVGSDHQVEAFAYHRGGPRKPSLVITTWDGYKKAGPLLISTEHRGTADGAPFRQFFTDVAVKLTGSDNWINAQ
jgi:hypothetical protein